MMGALAFQANHSDLTRQLLGIAVFVLGGVVGFILGRAR